VNHIWHHGIALAICLLALIPSVGATENGTHATFSPYAGTGIWSADFYLQNDPVLGVRVGAALTDWMGLEGTYGFSRTMTDFEPNRVTDVEHIGVDLVLSPVRIYRVTPYVTGGWSRLDYESGAIADAYDAVHQDFSAWEVGGGLKVHLAKNSAIETAFRLDARDIITHQTQQAVESSRYHSLIVSAGIEIAFRKTVEDRDRDGDGDGVSDSKDVCPDTPFRVIVDPFGCPQDSDEDGIPDGIDVCPQSVPGIYVDSTGCALALGPIEKEFLQSARIRRYIQFESGSAVISPESHGLLDEVGEVLVVWPTLQIEISGHTDATGSDELNQQLSEKRAISVLEYLIRRFEEIIPTRFTVMGYGEAKPIAANDNRQGRALNRRVEFTLKNIAEMHGILEGKRGAHFE